MGNAAAKRSTNGKYLKGSGAAKEWTLDRGRCPCSRVILQCLTRSCLFLFRPSCRYLVDLDVQLTFTIPLVALAFLHSPCHPGKSKHVDSDSENDNGSDHGSDTSSSSSTTTAAQSALQRLAKYDSLWHIWAQLDWKEEDDLLRSTLPYASLRTAMWMRERRRTKILAQQRLARSPAKPPSHERRPSMLARLINAIASSSSDSAEPSSSASSSAASASASAPYSRAVSASELAIQDAAGQLLQPHADDPSVSASKPAEQPVHIALVLALIRHFKKGRLLSTMLVVRLLMRARTVLKALPNVVWIYVCVCIVGSARARACVECM
jgi:hypothetical protein